MTSRRFATTQPNPDEDEEKKPDEEDTKPDDEEAPASDPEFREPELTQAIRELKARITELEARQDSSGTAAAREAAAQEAANVKGSVQLMPAERQNDVEKHVEDHGDKVYYTYKGKTFNRCLSHKDPRGQLVYTLVP